jgi:iron complex outermembrane receptor protein
MKKVFIGLMASFLLTGTPFSAAAQDNDYSDEFMLEEIVVTAQKREENQQKVAIAMDVISAEDMQEQGMNNIDEILSNVSNVFINKSSDGMRITLRGLSDNEGLSTTNQHQSTPTVAVNVDGAYSSNSNAGQNLFDVERVEVLFGPQSTMYSSNSPGGIVNIVTASPSTVNYSVNGSIDIGNYNKINAQAAVNIPVVTDKFALRAAGAYNKRDSYLTGSDSTTAEDTKSGRLKGLYWLTPDLSLSMTGTLSERGGGGGMGGAVEAFDYQDGLYEDGTEVTDPWTASAGSADGMSTADETTKGISGTIDWNSRLGTVTLTSAYNTNDTSSTQYTEVAGHGGPDSSSYYWAENISKNTQKNTEVRMTSSDSFFFKWILGATYYDSYDEKSVDYDDEDTVDTLAVNTEENKALYGNITYPVTHSLRATGGYRYSWDAITNDTVEQQGPNPGEHVIKEMEYANPDTKIGFEYDMAENAMLFADRSTSYRVNSMGMQNTDGDDLDPEELVAYTIGAKTRFMDNKLQFNVAAYLYDYKNKHANNAKEAFGIDESDYPELGYDVDEDGTTNEADVQIHDTNSQGYGAFESYGVDVQANWIVTNNDKVGLSVSYLHSEWTDLSFDYYYDYFEDETFDGVENIYAPNWTVNLSYDHNFNLWNGGTLTGHVDGLYSDDFILSWNPEDAPYNYQEAYILWNGSATYNHPTGRWSINCYMKNIFEYAVKTSYMDAGGSAMNLGIGDPRTFGAVLSFNY